MWPATLHIPSQEEQEPLEPQPALQAPGLQLPPPWGPTLTEGVVRESEQEAAVAAAAAAGEQEQEEQKEAPQLEQQEAQESGIPIQGGRVWTAQAAHQTSLPPRAQGSASSPNGAAMGPGWGPPEVWKLGGRVCGGA